MNMNQLELFPETVQIHVTLLWSIRGGIYLTALGPKAKIRTARVLQTLLEENFPSLLICPNNVSPGTRVNMIITMSEEEWTHWTDLGTQTDWVFTSKY